MANDKNGNPIDLRGMLTTVRPATLGKPKADLTFKVAALAPKMFRAEDGEIKVPRKRRGVDDTAYAWLQDLKAPETLFVFVEDPAHPENGVQVEWNEELQVFEGPPDDEGKRQQYENAGNILEMGIPDAREFTGASRRARTSGTPPPPSPSERASACRR